MMRESQPETIGVIKARSSIRKYKDRDVPADILKDIVDCGRLAPTGYNKQPWRFIVVTDNNLKDKIAAAASYGKFIAEAGACIAVFCQQDAETALEDACAATENMIIAAQAYDLGTCWVNSYQKTHSDRIKELLACPGEMELMTLIAVGYPDQDKNTAKKSLDEVMKWNTF